jgi:PHD/YefM family antitoxin component YafN of YafNO toxin-antitoxin module
MEAMLTETRKKPVAVGIREFRDNLAAYLLESDTPVTITRHGETVGIYIPVRRKRSNVEMEALREVHQKLQESMAAAGVTEDEIIEDFERLRKEHRNR